MERIHLVNPNDINTLLTSGVRMAQSEYVDRPEYVEHFHSFSSRGVVYLLTGIPFLSKKGIKRAMASVGATQVWLFGRSLAQAQTLEIIESLVLDVDVTLILRDRGLEHLVNDYRRVIGLGGVNIGIPCVGTSFGNGLGRLLLIKELIKQRKWDLHRTHYFWELENPAELAVYPKLFSSALVGSIQGFASKRCYVDSRYGIMYSGEVGLLCAPLEHMSFDESYTRGPQFTAFRLNDEMIQSYCNGALGDGLVHELVEQLEC